MCEKNRYLLSGSYVDKAGRKRFVGTADLKGSQFLWQKLNWAWFTNTLHILIIGNFA